MEEKTYPLQPATKGPRRARAPYHRARRWLADGENGVSPRVQVFVTQQAYLKICAHSQSDMDNEVGGWLAGRWCRDVETKKEFIVVEGLLPAQQVRSGSTFLTFTHDSQVAMLAALEERYAKKGVVGWYHTHPRMGIFLSGYDLWLHEHFFPQPWQVALVVEPHSGAGGFFVRDRKNHLNPRKYYGFYELHNRRVESVMDWINLHPEKVSKQESQRIEVNRPKKQVAEPPKPVQSTGMKPPSTPTAIEKKQESLPVPVETAGKPVPGSTEEKRVSVRHPESKSTPSQAGQLKPPTL
ncbi:MAG: Mov34/MPN/PAD-1 family protein, partial [Anaerolineales bacterium]